MQHVTINVGKIVCRIYHVVCMMMYMKPPQESSEHFRKCFDKESRLEDKFLSSFWWHTGWLVFPPHACQVGWDASTRWRMSGFGTAFRGITKMEKGWGVILFEWSGVRMKWWYLDSKSLSHVGYTMAFLSFLNGEGFFLNGGGYGWKVIKGNHEKMSFQKHSLESWRRRAHKKAGYSCRSSNSQQRT